MGDLLKFIQRRIVTTIIMGGEVSTKEVETLLPVQEDAAESI